MHANSRFDIAAGLKQDLFPAILVAIYWSLALLKPWDLFGDATETVYLVQNLAWLAFVLLHGSKRYGWDNILVFMGITFLITWSIETVSIATGFPFGNYHYTHLLGFKIGTVPLVVMPAYFAAGYLAWTMATVFLGNLGTGIEKRNLFLVPFVASFLMVMWDFCADPVNSTIDGAWIWHDGGAYHGVPISNFFGWYLTVFLFYQVFALYLYRFSRNEPFEPSKIYWYLAPVMFLGLALPFLLHPFFQTTDLVIYWSLFLGAIFTMVFTSILNIILVSRLGPQPA
ncbi:MAG: carotenoid biosynthesis protein [Anaerolineae bacterium]|jgi:putative membrane protein